MQDSENKNADEFDANEIRRIFELLGENLNGKKEGDDIERAFENIVRNMMRKSEIREGIISKNMFMNYIAKRQKDFELLLKTIFVR